MPWVKLDDQIADHPKIVKAGPLAAWLFVSGLAYCSRYTTDGDIPRGQVARLAELEEPMAAADKLVAVGLWERTADGFRVHDYLKYQPSAEQVRKDREATARRVEKWRSSKRHPARHRPGNASSNGVTEVGAAEMCNAVSTPSPDPVPEPGPGIETRSRLPSPTSEPHDARPPRASSESQTERSKGSKRRANRAPTGAELVLPPVSEDLAQRIQTIGHELGDDNVAASITRARRLQAAAGLDTGSMANAVKDAARRTQKRLDDFSRAPPGSPMAYFLAVLEQTTGERASPTA